MSALKWFTAALEALLDAEALANVMRRRFNEEHRLRSMHGSYVMRAFVLTLLMATFFPAPKAVADIVSYAIVKGDGTLQVRNRTIRLHGIYIPHTDRKSCRTFIRPIRCASRAALALDFKIGSHFVHCKPVVKYRDRSVSAVCYVGRTFHSDGEELGAYLIEHGLALAAPGAPFEYLALERIARAQNRGVWGFIVDSIR